MTTHQPVTKVCNCGAPGWMPGIAHFPSVAKGGYGIVEGQMRPDGAVVHTIEGWQHVMTKPSYTANSYHVTFRLKDGWTVQLVPIFTPAWHAGRVDSAPPTWPLYRPGVNPNSHSIGLSAEGAASAAHNPNGLPLAWDVQQVASAVRFLKWAGQEAGIAWSPRTLGEHSQIAVLTRRDPGVNWPKTAVLSQLGGDRNQYTVQRGDTLGAIASRYRVKTADLVAWNGISDPNRIEVGQTLYVEPPAAGPSPPPPVTPAALLEEIAEEHLRQGERIALARQKIAAL